MKKTKLSKLFWIIPAGFLLIAILLIELWPLLSPLPNSSAPAPNETPRVESPLELAAKFLTAVKMREPAEPIRRDLAEMDPAVLAAYLKNDAQRKAFWINLYNAFAQRHLTAEKLRDAAKRGEAFSRKHLPVAGHLLSLDDIEHGLLRRSKIKWALGYLNKPFPDRFERRFRVQRVDARIHFALNCGAASCPPIKAYSAEQIDKQLDLAARSYLGTSVAIDETEHVVKLPRIFLWFRGDFGGPSGMRDMLLNYGVLTDDTKSYNLKYQAWDWTPNMGHFEAEAATAES